MGFHSLVTSWLTNNATSSVCEVVRAAAEDAPAGEWLTERTRIAQELHDTLLQGFIAVSMQLHTAVDNLPPDDPSRSRFAGILRILDRALEEGRCTVQGLRSPRGPVASLGEAFAGVPSDLGLPSASAFRVVVHGRERELKAGLSDEVYCIGREAIINACRHAGARDIEAEVEYRATELRIAVRDDGCGIDGQGLEWRRKGHWGLRGMHERAERIGAQIRISSRVALGTEVELCVPGTLAFAQPPNRGWLLRWRRDSE